MKRILTKEVLLLTAMIVLSAAIFAVDSLIESDVAVGVSYIAVVWLSYLASDRRWIWASAAICFGLSVVGYLVSPPASIAWKAQLDRAIVLGAITGSAVLCNLAKRSQQRLRKHERELEELVQKRTAALQRSNSDLERFVYVASHDLQEPLRAVSGFCGLLQQHCADKLDGTAQSYINHVVEGADRMRRLIQGLLAYSRLQREEATVKPVDTTELLDNVRNDLQTLIRETNAKVTNSQLPVVPANPTQLHQMLQNLISNALKYRAERQPTIHVAARESEDFWIFAISDNGIGIDATHQERVFQLFQRLHTRDTHDGTGLGLAICKRIAEWHGGRIWVESSLGEGSTFFFSLAKDRKSFLGNARPVRQLGESNA